MRDHPLDEAAPTYPPSTPVEPLSTPTEPPRRKRRWLKILGVVALTLLVLGGTSYGMFAWGHHRVPGLEGRLAESRSKVADLQDQNKALEDQSSRQGQVIGVCQNALDLMDTELTKALGVLETSLDDFLYIGTLNALTNLEDQVARDKDTIDSCRNADAATGSANDAGWSQS